MRTLDFEVRTQVAKESINRVCEAAGLKSANKKRKADKKIQCLLGDRPDLHNAGFNVRLTITTDALDVVCEDGDRRGETICHHPMQGVSFASGGDAETLDFVAYVAKDACYARACHVLECGGGLAQDVLTTIGQAFELRFKDFLQNSPRAAEVPQGGNQFQFNQAPPPEETAERRQYYNDLPTGSPATRRQNGGDIRGTNISSSMGGILLQDNQPPPPIPPLLPAPHLSNLHASSATNLPSPTSTIDSFGSTAILGFESSTASSNFNTNNSFNNNSDNFNLMSNNHINGVLPSFPPPPTSSPPPVPMQGDGHDPGFDPVVSNQPFNPASRLPPPPTEDVDTLYQEDWFHGKISRSKAESLLRNDGDFLVRESSHQERQFVLSGLHAGAFKHLLLIDPQGVVRTKDKKFDNVSHLIRFHRHNVVPIVSEDSELLLVNPVVRRQ